MRVGEALSRCPELRLVPPDPEGVRSLWGDGARPARGDRRAGGVRRRGGGASSRRAGSQASTAAISAGVLGAPRAGRSGTGARFGRRAQPLRRLRGRPAGASARGAGTRSRWRRRGRRRFLAPLPVGSAAHAARAGRRCPRRSSGSGSAPSASWRRCPRARWPSASGIPGCWRSTWRAGATPRSSRAARPSRCSSGSSCPRRRRASSSSARSSCSIARVLARRERRGRSLRALARVGALRGRWHLADAVTLRQASADPARIRLRSGPQAGRAARARRLARRSRSRPSGRRRRIRGGCSTRPPRSAAARLGEAVRQARQAAGADAALRVLDVDPDSRFPSAARCWRPSRTSTHGDAGALTPARGRRKPAVGAPRRRAGRAAASWPARRSSPCARNGWWRTAGGRAGRCGGATSSWCSTTGATSWCSATWSAGAGSSSGLSPSPRRPETTA